VFVECLAVGVAVVKILLRIADKENAADILDDVHGGLASLRAAGQQTALAKSIGKELEQHLGGTSGEAEADLRAAARDVADLLNNLDDGAVVVLRIMISFWTTSKGIKARRNETGSLSVPSTRSMTCLRRPSASWSDVLRPLHASLMLRSPRLSGSFRSLPPMLDRHSATLNRLSKYLGAKTETL
jgi:hypothetical protein